MSDRIHLTLVADDFGMHPAVNEGITKAFLEGILTDTNLMTPCPAIDEALALTKTHAIPVGLHATFTCDWDIYRWGPITDAPSLCDAEGMFKESVAAAWSVADAGEAMAELRAQLRRVTDAGIAITHVGEHMGTDEEGRMRAVMNTIIREEQVPYKGLQSAEQTYDLHLDWAGRYNISRSTGYDDAKSRFLAHLAGLQAGHHLAVCHPAIDHPVMDELCSPDFHARLWARFYRANDLALMLDPEIADRIAELGIVLTPLTEVPQRGSGPSGE